VVVVAAVVALATQPSGDRTVTAGPRGERLQTEREVEVPGIAEPLRVSTTSAPVHGYASFGAVPLAGGAITGAVQTTRTDGIPIVIVAVTAGPETRAVEVRGPGGTVVQGPVRDGRAMAVYELEQRDPLLVIDVVALDGSGSIRGSARVTPFIQDPISCDTNTQLVDPADPPSDPTYVAHLDAYLAAPLPAVCGG
jgi:hypothetical protein